MSVSEMKSITGGSNGCNSLIQSSCSTTTSCTQDNGATGYCVWVKPDTFCRCAAVYVG